MTKYFVLGRHWGSIWRREWGGRDVGRETSEGPKPVPGLGMGSGSKFAT